MKMFDSLNGHGSSINHTEELDLVYGLASSEKAIAFNLTNDAEYMLKF